MFSTCLFCHAPLGANQSIEHFPIGRRLAYDPERGRFWAVCKRCTRWNLTPLDERWEAIEECERAYRETRKRVSTDNIALARLADGTDLVRIGQPLLPEFAAWRYGEQLGVRRLKHFALRSMPEAVFMIGMFVSGAMMIRDSGYVAYGVSTGVALQWAGLALHRLTTIPVAHVTVPGTGRLPMRAVESYRTIASYNNDGVFVLETALQAPRRFLKFSSKATTFTLMGDEAKRAMSDVIVGVNHQGAKSATTSDAVRLLEDGATVSSLLFSVASPTVRNAPHIASPALLFAPHAQRLALEIALHEENERRAMAGELGALHARWEEAERVATITDRELTQLLDAAVTNPDAAAQLARHHKPGE